MTTKRGTVWYLPDGYLPRKQEGGALEAHEALMILNPNRDDARIQLDFYFEDKPPVKGIAFTVGAERVRSYRLDHPEEIGNVQIPPLTQYALRVRSDLAIVAQFGRLDTTQPNLAHYTTIGYCVAE
jgi:hypothetical protein